MPVHDNGDLIVDIRNFPSILLDSRKGDDSGSYYMLRQSVVEKLLEAADRLPAGICFLVIEGYRPLSLQKQYFDEYSEELRRANSDWDESRIYNEASKFVAPPEIIPPHSTGGAVDLTLANAGGTELGMGTELNEEPERCENACFTLSGNLNDDAKKNRQLLIDAMSQTGFVNYPTEWWHWSYGDRYWAYQTGQSEAIFGTVDGLATSQ